VHMERKDKGKEGSTPKINFWLLSWLMGSQLLDTAVCGTVKPPHGLHGYFSTIFQNFPEQKTPNSAVFQHSVNAFTTTYHDSLKYLDVCNFRKGPSWRFRGPYHR